MAAAVAALRQVLEQRFPDAVPPAYRTVAQLATGIAKLDGILPGGGLPRGRLAVWAPGGAATALLRAACDAVAGRGERAVWVDGAGTVAGAYWVSGPYLIRPRGERQALQCAEELLRCGGFGLVVLAGVRPGDVEAVRLSRAAREGGGAFVVLGHGVSTAGLRLASRIRPEDFRWRLDPWGTPAEVVDVRVHIHATALGWSANTHFRLPVTHHGIRLSLESGLADRRGTRA
ncbi:MAG: hypothetical protein H0X52_04770 [Gemmatimonadetes bacterium]|nr:hypothetical protein [Gemmatimonadota bacterium]